MKSYFLVPIVFIMSLLSSCQELGNPYTESVSVKSIQVDTCYYSSKNDCIWYGLNVQIDKFVSPYSFVKFVFEIGDKGYYVGSDSSLDGEFYLLLNLPVSEYTFDYVANIASTGRCYVYVSGFEYVGRYEYGKFKYTLPSFDAILPKGETFNYKVNDFIAKNGGITEIVFIANSSVKSSDQLVRDDVYMVKNQNVLEIHTLADSFVVNEDASWMFGGLESIKTIDFGENFRTQNVTDMCGMFSWCSSLTSLDLSNFDTQNVTDMRDMFYKCSNLTSLDLSNFDTQNVTDMSYMFSSCSNLSSLDLSNFDTQNVTDMGWMFNNCTSLTSLDLSNFDTQNVTTMYGMFFNCTSLTSLDLSNFDTQNVTDMSDMFSWCSGLTSLDVSNFDTQNVTNMTYMFSGCTSLTSLDVSNFDTQNVTNMKRMFYDCSSLTLLDVSNFNTQDVTDMGYMFSRCSSLTSLDLSNFDTQDVTDMGYMFSSCSNLSSLDVSNFDTQNVTDMSYIFAYVGKLSELNLLNFDFISKPQTQNMFYYLGSSAVNRPIPIYVTTDGKFYLQGKDDTGINSAYAVLTSVDDSNFEVPGGGEHGDEEWL